MLAELRSVLPWFLWWLIDPAELEIQVSQYDSLSIFKSMRGNCALALLLGIGAGFALVALGRIPLAVALIDGGLLGVFVPLVYLGQRWALVAVMVYWTASKALLLIAGPPQFWVVQVAWWCFYMHIFYFAFRIEQARRQPKAQAPQSSGSAARSPTGQFGRRRTFSG